MKFRPVSLVPFLLGPLLAVPSVLTAQEEALEITNFASGPICTYDDESGAWTGEVGVDGQGSICEAVDVEVRGEGRCVYAGEEKACTWFGFKFDYENKDEDEPITCIWRRSQPVDEGDVEEVRKRGAVADTFDLAIEGTRGHYWSPFYNVYGAPPRRTVVTIEYDCTYRGEPAFDTRYRLIFSPSRR